MSTRPRIAIPMPHSLDPEYAERAIPQYERAVELAGGEPVRIPLSQAPSKVIQLIAACDGVLLPGSKADVDPQRFEALRSPHTAAADPGRDAVDDLLLDDAYRLRKPVLGICYGLQSLNVYRAGSLVQHIPEFLPEEKRRKVNHEAGKKVAVAHTVEIEPGSKLSEIVADALSGPVAGENPHSFTDSERAANSRETGKGTSSTRAAAVPAQDRALAPAGRQVIIPVNSSHHQSADAIGDGLRIVGRCREDGIIEALEGTAPDHFVLAVQWHPERSVEEDAASRAIFGALVEAARARRGVVASNSVSG
jgi:putative glutamine amidotransferase